MILALILAPVCLLVGVFLWVLLSVSKDEDRAARHLEKSLDPFSDVCITIQK